MRTLTLPLEAEVAPADVWYYSIEPQYGDTARRMVIDWSCSISNFISHYFQFAIIRWDWCAELYWAFTDFQHRLFDLYFVGSEEELSQMINGEMPLEYCDEDLLSRIHNRREVYWTCARGDWRGREIDSSIDSQCPLCGFSLYLR